MDQRFVVPGVDAHTRLSKAAPLLLLAKAEPLFALEQAAAGGADMDAVHDMRVASRRLRETMRLLGPLYPRQEFKTWYNRVRRVTRALGPVRDSDVFIDDFSRLSKSLGEGGRRCVAFMVGYRTGQRVSELAALNRELGRLDLAESKRSFQALARSPRPSAESKRSLADFAHAAVAERSGVVFGALPDALPEENILQQHALRIDFKRLRYAVEVFATCYGEEFDALHATLTAFQDTLGDLHDIHVFLDMLRLPERVEATSRAGVSAEDIGEVVTLLERRTHKTFLAFAKLAENNPASALLPALLLPLSRAESAPMTIDGDASPGAEATTHTDAETPAQSALPLPPTPELAVVLEPAATVPDAAAMVDPTAQPWRSDAAGLSIHPPIVVGAEPWARTPSGSEVE